MAYKTLYYHYKVTAIKSALQLEGQGFDTKLPARKERGMFVVKFKPRTKIKQRVFKKSLRPDTKKELKVVKKRYKKLDKAVTKAALNRGIRKVHL